MAASQKPCVPEGVALPPRVTLGTAQAPDGPIRARPMRAQALKRARAQALKRARAQALKKAQGGP